MTPSRTPKEKHSASIAKATRKFLRNGGKIIKLPAFVRSTYSMKDGNWQAGTKLEAENAKSKKAAKRGGKS